MPYRTLNEQFLASDLLTILADIMLPQTALADQGGQAFINGIGAQLTANGPWPALLLMEMDTSRGRIGVDMWQGRITAEAWYLAPYQNQSGSLDAVWAAVDLDFRRMIANVEDNPRLIWPNPGGVRYASDVPELRLSPLWDREVDDTTWGIPVVKRTCTISINGLPYVSAG